MNAFVCIYMCVCKYVYCKYPLNTIVFVDAYAVLRLLMERRELKTVELTGNLKSRARVRCVHRKSITNNQVLNADMT